MRTVEDAAVVVLRLAAIGIAALLVNYLFDEILKMVPRG